MILDLYFQAFAQHLNKLVFAVASINTRAFTQLETCVIHSCKCFIGEIIIGTLT